MGSDPNSLPEFYIRGRSGVGVMELDKDAVSQSALSNNPNTPIFIMDGFEVSVSKVYDFDPNRIERITIFKRCGRYCHIWFTCGKWGDCD